MPVTVVVGLGWGDEGKGKIVDILSEKAAAVARGQGGNNAGHTVIADGKEYRFHLVPSGILHAKPDCFLGAGVVIDPLALVQEMEHLQSQGVVFHGRFYISPYAHVILSKHKEEDKQELSQKIGTTGRGIGPCIVDRVARRGVRIGEWIGTPCKEAAFLAPFVAPFEEELIRRAAKEEVLLEGAQGALLDILFGTYPYVTSSSTITAGICQGVGISHVNRVVGVMKAYATRVGAGPMPTELSTEDLSLFPEHAACREIGTTTGRKRRIGWFDAILTQRALLLCGVHELALMKLDVLDNLKRLRIATHKDSNGQLIYEEMAGWHQSTHHIRTFEALPQEAQAYVKRLEALLQCPISIISVGPEREALIRR